MNKKLKINEEIAALKLIDGMTNIELGNYLIMNILPKFKRDVLDESVLNKVIEKIFELDSKRCK